MGKAIQSFARLFRPPNLGLVQKRKLLRRRLCERFLSSVSASMSNTAALCDGVRHTHSIKTFRNHTVFGFQCFEPCQRCKVVSGILYTIFPKLGCETSCGTQINVDKPLTVNDADSLRLLRGDYKWYKNGGIEGSISAGCVVYNF